MGKKKNIYLKKNYKKPDSYIDPMDAYFEMKKKRVESTEKVSHDQWCNQNQNEVVEQRSLVDEGDEGPADLSARVWVKDQAGHKSMLRVTGTGLPFYKAQKGDVIQYEDEYLEIIKIKNIDHSKKRIGKGNARNKKLTVGHPFKPLH